MVTGDFLVYVGGQCKVERATCRAAPNLRPTLLAPIVLTERFSYETFWKSV